MSLTAYLLGAGLLIAIAAAAGFVGLRLRVVLLPAWSGPPAVLAAAVAGVASLTVVAELLGAVGLFRRGPIAAAMLAAAVAVAAAARRRLEPGPAAPGQTGTPRADPPLSAPAAGRGEVLLAVAGAAAVVAQWSTHVADAVVRGARDTDSLQHHLPFAARFVQESLVGRLHFAWLDPVWSYYPSNAELLQGVAMLPLHRDLAVPLLSLGWLGLALLAGWCFGRPWGVGPATMTAVGIVAASPIMAATQAGGGGNDIAVLALWVAALALLANARSAAGTEAAARAGGAARIEPGALGLAALAAGLAAGTKLSMLAPVGALFVALVVSSRRGSRLRAAGWWAAGLAVGGGFWYVRNLLLVGNPVPALDLPGLPSPPMPAVDAYGFSVADYLTDGRFWSTVVPEGLARAFGPAWPVIGAVAAAGLVVAVVRGPGRAARAAGAVGLVATVAYALTPTSAYGPPGNPYLFYANLRYLTPALVLGLLLVPVLPAARAPARRPWVLSGMLALAVVTLLAKGPLEAWAPGRARLGVAAGLAVLVLASAVRRRSRGPGVRMAAGLAAAVVLLAAGRASQTRLEAGRYADLALGRWAAGLHGARIGVTGIAEQYPLYGLDLSNRVDYIGRRGPRGSFASVTTCDAFRVAVTEGRYEFVVTGPQKWQLEAAPEAGWMRSDPGATLVLEAGRRLVFRVVPGATPSPCE
jgi:hypothetical protein